MTTAEKEVNGKELLLRAIHNQTTVRPAWVPFVGVHGAQLIGKTASEYLQSSELMLEGLNKACDLYQPDGLPVAFDLQLEAEILGCELNWAEKAPPAVCSHPLEQGKDLGSLPAFDVNGGRLPLVMDVLRTLKAERGDDLALYGLICGPFTLALHLMGNNIFLQMFDNPDYVKAVIGFCALVGQKTAAAYIENGADVIAVVDPMTSQISPEHFEGFVTPYVNQVFDAIRTRGSTSSLFVCGDASRNLEVMSRTTCDNVSIDENIPLEQLRDITRSGKKSFGGNLKLTAVLLLGDADDSKLDAIRCIDIGGGCGFVLAPGCDLPFDTPAANLQAVSEMVHDSYKREVAKRTIIAKSAQEGHADLPESYDDLSEVRVDVITLDSASCAPCQYMVDAIKRVQSQVSKPIAIQEHRITTREGLAAMARLGVKNIPTICIDGKPTFVSIIPDQRTLLNTIETAVAEKNA